MSLYAFYFSFFILVSPHFSLFLCAPTLFIYFIYLFLAALGLVVRGLSLVAASGGYTLCCSARASHRGGFSYCGAQALGVRASVVVACRLNSCGARA